MHSANTVMANIIPYAARLQLDAEDVVLMASPMWKLLATVPVPVGCWIGLPLMTGQTNIAM
jgi:hypothetical protein